MLVTVQLTLLGMKMMISYWLILRTGAAVVCVHTKEAERGTSRCQDDRMFPIAGSNTPLKTYGGPQFSSGQLTSDGNGVLQDCVGKRKAVASADTGKAKRRRADYDAASDEAEHTQAPGHSLEQFVVTDASEARCCVCTSGEFTPRNQIVLCDGPCRLAYHQSCWKLDYVPEGDWYCSAKCRAAARKQGMAPVSASF